MPAGVGQDPSVKRFGSFELDLHRRELRHAGGQALHLTPKALDVLAVLVRERGRTVPKRALIDEVWPGRVLEDNNLSQAIAALRRAFGTCPSDHAYLVTVPGQGYRFVAEVEDAGAVDPRAFRSYLVGRYLMNRPDPSRLPAAVAALQDAIDVDPTYARAYAALSFAYRAWCITGDRAPLDVLPLARAAADQALAIDPNLAEAHAQKGFIQFWHEWDWAAAEATMRKAVSLDPNMAECRLALAHLLANLRRFDEALAEVARAEHLDPLSPLIATLHAGFLGYAGMLGEARARALRAIELAPRFPPAWLHLGQILFDAGDIAGAVEALETGARLTTSSQLAAKLGVAYAAAARTEDAERILEALRGRTADGYVPPSSMAAIEAALGRLDAAVDLLEEGERVRDVRLAFLAVDTRWRPLQGLPRFAELLARMRLPGPAHA